MSSLVLGEHRGYLADDARLKAYRDALRAVVRPGDTVLDLGSGTGILGVLACQAGAGAVYAVDATSMAAVARAVAKANGLADRITVLQAHSRRVELPERVDVVVADQLGPLGVEAGMLEAFADARRRHLKPGGAFVPRRLDLVVAPIRSTRLWDEVGFWDRPVDGVDVSAVAGFARNCRYYGTSEPGDLLGPPAVAASLDPSELDRSPIAGRATLPVERAGTLHGLAAWFSVELAEGVHLSNGPVPSRVARDHVLLPVAAPVDVEPGERVEVAFAVQPPQEMQWRIEVWGPGATAARAGSSHATADGRPVSRDDLARSRPDHRPVLSPRAAARRTAIDLMDGEHTLAEIEAAVAAAHADLFADAHEIAVFVSELVTRET